MRAHRQVALSSLATLTLLLVSSSALAQRYDYDDDVDGAETCRAIWREYGRTMSGSPRAVFCEVRDIGTAARRSTIDVDGGSHNGVRITGAARSDMRVRLVIQAQGDDIEDARSLARRVSLDLSSSTLRADVPDLRSQNQPRRGRRFVAATILVDVPVESNVSASAQHAPLEIENLRGRIDVRGQHGPVSLRDVGGDVRARVDHGPLGIDLSGQRWQGTGLDAVAQHGPLTLSMPRDYAADLEIGAQHGPMSSDFPLTVNRFDRSNIQTRIGGGGPPIRAFAYHGPLSLRVAR